MKKLLLALSLLCCTGVASEQEAKAVKEDTVDLLKPSQEVQDMLKKFCCIDDEGEETEKSVVFIMFAMSSKKKV